MFRTKTWLEGLQQYTERVFDLYIEPMVSDTEITEQKYEENEKKLQKNYTKKPPLGSWCKDFTQSGNNGIHWNVIDMGLLWFK